MHCCCQARGQDEDDGPATEDPAELLLSLLVGLETLSTHLRCPHYPTWLSLPCSRFLFLTLFSFLVRASLPSSLVRWDERKTVPPQMSQGLSNNAFLEVTVQLQQRNQALLDRLASQQSVNGSVMAQARHSPATCSVFSTIHPAADSAWKHLKAESVPARATSDKVIIQDGRSDPAAQSFKEFRLADACICLATRSEADEATRETSLGRGLAILAVNIARMSVKKEVLFPKTCWLFAVVREGLVPRFPTTRCSPRTVKFGSSLPILRSSVLLIFASGGFGVVFVNPLFAQFHPDLLHLPATVKSLSVMCLKNLLCPLPTGCFKGNNSVTAFMMFLGTEGRLAYVCVLAFRLTTDPRHRHARPCAMTARCAGKKRTRRPCHRRSRRVSPFIAVRVGEATHRGRCLRSISVARTVRRGCPTDVLCGTTSCDSTSPRPTSSPVMGKQGGSTETIGPRRTEHHRSRRIHHPAFQRSGFHLAGR